MANLPSFKNVLTGKVYAGGVQVSEGERKTRLKERQSDVPIFQNVSSGKIYDGTQAVIGRTTPTAKAVAPTYDPNKRYSGLGRTAFPSSKDRYTASDVNDAESWLKAQSEMLDKTRGDLEQSRKSWGDIRIGPPSAGVQYAEAEKRRTPLTFGEAAPGSYYDQVKAYKTGIEEFQKNYGAYEQMLQQIESGADDYDARAAELQKQAGEAREQERRLLALASERRMNTAQAQQIAPEIEYWRRQAEDLEKQARELKDTAAMAPGIRFQRKYGGLSGAEDFAEASGYREELTEEGPAANDLTRKWEFPLYEIVNGNDEARDAYTARRMNLYGGGMNPLGALWGGVADNAAEAQDMTEDEVKLFNYIYHTQGREAAQEFYDDIQSNLNARRRIREQEEWGAYAKEKPFESSLFSVVESPLRGMSYLGQAADLLDDGKIDQNAGYNRFTQIPGDIRSAVSKEIEDSGKWGKAGSFLYQTGMSMGDFLWSTAVSGGNEALSLAIMGTGAAADTVITAKERGLSDKQAFALGTIAGAAEVITEKVSLEALLDKTSLTRSALGYFLKNVLAEGSEEVGSDLINLVADVLIARDKSEWQTAIRKMREENPELSQKQAFWRAVLDQAQQMGLDFLGGAISGGVMAGGSIAVNAAANYAAEAPTQKMNRAIDKQYAAIDEYGLWSPEANEAMKRAGKLSQKTDTTLRKGREVNGNFWPTQEEYDLESRGMDYLSRGPEAVTELIELGLESPEGSQSRRIAMRLDAALENGTDVDMAKEVARLYDTLYEETETETEPEAEAEQVVETPAQDKPDDNWPVAPDTLQVKALRTMAEESGIGEKGAEAMGAFYSGERMNEYYGGFAAAYNAGMENRELETVQTPLSMKLTPVQRQAAWNAGRMDAIRNEAAETKTAPTAQSSASVTANSMTGGQTNAEWTGRTETADDRGEFVSDGGGERDAGLRAGEPAGRVERGTGSKAAAGVRTASERHALVRDLRLRPADPVNDFGIRNAVNTGDTYVLPEDQLDEPLRKIEEKNRRSGVKTVFVLGSIPFRKKNGQIRRARGAYVRETNTVYVQADNVSATPEQIAEHELWHARYNASPEQDRLLEERIRENFGAEAFEKVLDKYISAMYGVIDLHEGMTDEEYAAALRLIKNELFADAVSGLNGFGAGATQFTETAQQFRDEYWGGNEQTAEATERKTGPPAEAQFSIERTRDMPWEDQVEGYFSGDGSIRTSDSLYLGMSGTGLSGRGIDNAPLYVPTSVINKATRKQKGSRSGHELSAENIRDLKDGIKNATAVIHNPARNSAVYITDLTDRNGNYIVASFDLNHDLYGENAHRATSIHGRESILNLLKGLGSDAKVFVTDENKFNRIAGLQSGQSPELLATVELIDKNIASESSGVNPQFSEDSDTDELRRELRARGNVETRRALANESREAFNANETERRRIRKELRENESKPKEIAAVEKELARLQDKQYQHDLLESGGQDAIIRNAREISRLQQRLERLRGETAEEKPAKGRKKAAKKTNAPTISVRQLQNDLLRYMSTPEGQKADMRSIISSFADKVYREGKITQEDVDALMDALYGAGVVTVPATDYQRAGRGAVKDGRIYVPDYVKAEFGDDWNAFRIRAMAAGIHLVNDSNARGADQWNVELSELFPGIFNADDTDLRGIIEQIVQLAEEGKDQHMSLADYTAMLAGREYMTEDQLREEMERHIDWALRTFAEKAGLEVHLKDRADRMVQQERAAAWERRQQEQTRRKADRELREMQQKTLKQVQWLEKNRNQAPAVLRPKIDEVLSDLNFYSVHAVNEMRWSSKYKMTFGEIADLIDRKTNEESKERDINFIPTKEMVTIWKRVKLNNSAIKNIGDMDIGDLRQLYNAAVQLRQEVYDRNNLINDEFNRTVAGVAADSMDELEAAAKDQLKKNILRKYDEMQLTPMNRFESMAGWKRNSTWASMARMLEKGERDQRRFTVNAKAMLADFLQQNRKWVQRADGQGKDGIWYEVEFSPVTKWGEMDQPIFGEPVKVWMTPAMKVQLYLESKSEDNLRHMAGGRTFANRELYSMGKRADAFKQGAQTFMMTPEAVRKIVSDLTAEEKALADVLEQFYNDFSKTEINRVSNALYGYDKAMGRYYAPIFTDSNYNRSEPGIFDITAEGVGNLKSRKESWTPSMMISAFDAFEKSVDKTAKFVGLAIPVRNVNAVLNWQSKGKSMKKVLDDTQGAGTAKFVEDLMTELQGNKEMKRPKLEQLMDKALSKYVSAVFGFNPSIVLKQFASFPLAASYLGWGNMPKWIPGAAQVDRELVRTYTGELAYRNMGYATPETALLKDNPGVLQTKGPLNFVFGGGAINWMDDFTVRTLWTWAENKVRKDQPKLRPGTQEQIAAGTDDFYKAVASEFEEAVSRSQPMYDTMHRSQVMREGGGLARAFTMFKTVPQQEYNMLREAFGEMAAAKESGDAAQKKAASAKVGRAISGVVVGNLMIGTITFLNALLKNGAKAYRDDDDELTPESVMKQVGLQYFRDSIGLAIGGDVIADVIGAAAGAKWYGVEAPGVEQVNEILEGISNAGKNMQRLVKDSIEVLNNGGDWKKYMREHSSIYVRCVENTVKLLGTYLGGLPVNNIRAYLLGAMQWMSPEVKTAYEDAMQHADRSGLKGLSGAALEMRTEHILSGRLDEPSDELVKALAALYAEGYTNAVPTDTPGSVSIDGEDYALNLVQQQTYSNAWRDAIGDALEDLIGSEEYRNAGGKARESMIRKIYDYAAAEAKGAVFSQFDAEEKNKTANAAMMAGASLDEWAQISARFSEIDADKSKTSAQRGAMKRAAILAMDLTDQEKLDLYAVMAPAESRTAKLQAIKNAGLSAKRVFEIYDKYDEIGDESLTASEKAASFSRWIDGQHFTDRQAAAIREQLVYRTSTTASAGSYDKFTAAGISPEKSYALFETLRKLQPEAGKENVTDGQKLHAIADSRLTDAEKISAMGVILGTELINEYGNPTGYAKMRTLIDSGTTIKDYLKLRDAGQVDGYIKLRDVTAGMDYGVSADTYVRFRQSLHLYDADGNGSFTQKEVQAAIDGMAGEGDNPLLGSGLTTAQKAVLWQMANSSWKPAKNPYNTRVGQDVYDGLKMLKDLDALKAIGSGSDNPLLLGGISDTERAFMELALSMNN